MIVYIITIASLAALAMAGSILYVSHKEDERERELEQKRQSTPKNYHHGKTDDELIDGIKKRAEESVCLSCIKQGQCDNFCHNANIWIIQYTRGAYEQDAIAREDERLRCARAAADVFKEHASRMQRLGEERGVYLYFSIAEFYDDLLERLNK